MTVYILRFLGSVCIYFCSSSSARWLPLSCFVSFTSYQKHIRQCTVNIIKMVEVMMSMLMSTYSGYRHTRLYIRLINLRVLFEKCQYLTFICRRKVLQSGIFLSAYQHLLQILPVSIPSLCPKTKCTEE